MAATDLSSSPALPTQTATPESPSQERSHSSTQEEEQDKQQQQTQQDDDEYLFSCRCDSAKAVSSLLSCLTTSASSSSSHDKKKTSASIQPVTVFCTPTALTFHVYGTSAKQSQASVDMNKGMFCDYQISQNGEFSVNLTSVLECLHILGNHHLERTKLCWAFSPSSQTFEMELLEEGGVLSTAAIPGLLPSSSASSTSLALAFSQSPIVSRILLKSEWLKQAWNELQHVPGATTCTVAITKKSLQLATVGHAGECIVSLPATTSTQGSLLLSLECQNSKNAIPQSYPWQSFQLGMKGLEIAEETCLTINQAGMMAIQHQILDTVGDGDANFVDFLMASLEQTEGEEEEVVANVPPPLSLEWKSQDNDEGEQEQEKSSDDSEEESPPISAAPLFGTVVHHHQTEDNASVSTNNTRNVRRRRREQRSLDTSMNEDDDDESSEEEEEATSVTPQRRRRRHRRRERQLREQGASSPEIGYGDDSD